MRYSELGFKLGFVALALGLSGWASGNCNMTGTNADSAQSDSGNGNYTCSLVSTAKGTLQDVTSQVHWQIVNGNVKWWVDTANGYPTVDVDLASVSSNSGKRCNYSYASQQSGGEGLTSGDLTTPKYVTFCADTYIAPEPPPTPPKPIDTAKKQCNVTFDYANKDPNAPPGFDVAIGYTKDYWEGDLEGLAVCAPAGGTQNPCINECVTQVPSGDCDPSNYQDGKLPLSCAACDPSPEYCWYYENHVKDGYFKPSPKKKSLSAQIDVTTGSNCYTVTVGPMYGGYTYSYQYCPY